MGPSRGRGDPGLATATPQPALPLWSFTHTLGFADDAASVSLSLLTGLGYSLYQPWVHGRNFWKSSYCAKPLFLGCPMGLFTLI